MPRPVLLVVGICLLAGGCGGGGKETTVAPPSSGPPIVRGPFEGFFVARPAQITRDVVENGPHARRFPGAEWEEMETVEVGTLGAILGADNYDSLEAQMEKSARDCASGECGLFRVPASVRDQLAVMTHPSLFAHRWVATEEMQADHVLLGAARPLLILLRRLAREAKAEGSQLWVWWST